MSLLLFMIVWTSAQGSSGAEPADVAWPIRFADDFRTDRRPEYRNGDDLEWQPGMLIIPADAVFWKEITPGARAELDVTLDFAVDANELRSQTDFPIPYSGHLGIVTRITVERRENSAPTTTVEILKQDQGAGGKESILARVEPPAETADGKPWNPSGPWGLHYRYGHLQVLKDGMQVLSAYVPHHRSCAGIMCWQKSGRVGIRSYALRAIERPPENDTPKQRRDFDAAVDALSKAQSAFEGADFVTAVAESERAWRGFEGVLNAEHPYTLLAAGVFGSALSQFPERQAEARRLLEDTLRRAEAVFGAGHPEVAKLWSRIAGARLIQDDPCGAMAAYRTAADIRRDAEGSVSYERGVGLIQLGGAAAQCGNPEVADAALEEAIRILEATGQPPVIADAHMHLAKVLTDRGAFESAKPRLDEALKLYEQHEPGGISYVECRMHLAEWFLSQDYEAEAQAAYKLALDAAKGLGPDHDYTMTALGMLGTLAGEHGDQPAALSYLDQVVQASRRRYGNHSLITARSLLWKSAAVQRSGEFREALALAAEGLDIELRVAENVLPVVSEAEGIEFIQSAYVARDYVLSNLRHIPKTNPEHAYDIVRRSRSLVSRFGERYWHDPSGDAEWSRLAIELTEARTRLGGALLNEATNEETVARLQDSKESLERRLRQRSNQLNVRGPTHIDDLDSVYVMLPDTTAVVELLRSVVPDNDGELYDAFVVRRDSAKSAVRVEWIPLGVASAIDAAVRAWQYGILNARGIKPPRAVAPLVEEAAQTLREKVWLPLEPALAGVEHVIVVPDAALGRLAWGALPDAQSGHVLLERFAFSEVTTAASLQDIFSRTPMRSTAPNIALVGGIYYGVDANGTVRPSAPHWPYLRGTADEVSQIESLLPADWPNTVLSKEFATPDAVRDRMQSANEIVLSTHGYFDDRQGWGSGGDLSEFERPTQKWLATDGPIRPQVRSPLALCGLVLSPTTTSGTDDSPPDFTEGRLTGEMIAQLDLSKMQLAVLSACESGLGDTAGGEGVFGLQRAFEMAGTRATVASLWSVPDSATQRLMVRFFENRWQRGMGNLAALREAQLWIRSGGETPASEPLSPYYWGAFVLTGDWR